MLNVAIVAGGDSGEYGISMKSGKQVELNMDLGRFVPYLIEIKGQNWNYIVGRKKFPVDKNDFSLTIGKRKVRFDIVFNAIHGTPGENGKLQGYFDILGIPYTSCDVTTSALTFNKQFCKDVVASAGVPTARSLHLFKGGPDPVPEIIKRLTFPLFIKPNNGGSSVGMSKVNEKSALKPALLLAFNEDNEILVEEFVRGRELTCGVLRTAGKLVALPVTEIIPKKEYFDYEAKYKKGMADEVVPADVPEKTAAICREISCMLYERLHCKGVVRFDYIYTGKKFYFLEVNTVPGLSAASIVPKMARAQGWSFTELVTRLISEELGVRMRKIQLLIFLLFVYSGVFSQATLFKGVVTDEQTLKPIQDVNIKVYGTTQGTATDPGGNFTLKLKKIPATLIFTFVGYESASYTVTDIPQSTVEFQLRPKSYLLQEVDISSKKYSYLFKDQDYSVLDYEILGDRIALLIFKYQLKQSELMLLARNGDTLAFSPLPEMPPGKLFKDFLANVHYISKAENAFQFLYNEQHGRIEFYHGKTVDSLNAFVKSFIFKLSGRLYFQERLAGGFGTAFGYYERGNRKRYIRQVINEKKITEQGDDQIFYQKWNGQLGEDSYFSRPSEYSEPPEFDFSRGFPSSAHFEENEARAHQFEFYKMIYPVFNIAADEIAFFNFASDSIQRMDKDGKLIHASPITFHKKFKAKTSLSTPVKLSNPDWRWGTSVLVDEYTREAYTTYLKNGMVRVQRIDLETGELKNGTVLPFPYPEKIEIYKGDAYFLIKQDGTSDKWKLMKCKI